MQVFLNLGWIKVKETEMLEVLLKAYESIFRKSCAKYISNPFAFLDILHIFYANECYFYYKKCSVEGYLFFF